MKIRLIAAGLMLAAPLVAAPFAASPVSAQVQLNVCGAPPLPPCYPRRGPPPEYEPRFDRGRGFRDDDDRDRDFGRICRTRYERCRVEPRPMDGRCSCTNEDGEDVIGRIVR